MSTFDRLKAYTHWIKLETEASEDRLLLARDIDKLIAVVMASQSYVENNGDYSNNGWGRLRDALAELERGE